MKSWTVTECTIGELLAWYTGNNIEDRELITDSFLNQFDEELTQEQMGYLYEDLDKTIKITTKNLDNVYFNTFQIPGLYCSFDSISKPGVDPNED